MVTTQDRQDREHAATYIKSDAIDFAREMLYRHAIVLRGVASSIEIKAKRFVLVRPDSSHLVIWSAETQFLKISPATLNDAVVFVRGRPMNGLFLVETVALAE